MKMIRFSFLLFFVLLCIPFRIHAETTIQSQIDDTPAYGTVKLKNGMYNETIEISKPITLEGEKNTKIRFCGNKPVIKVNGENVTVKRLKIEQCKKREGTAAVYVAGAGHNFTDLEIRTQQIGMKLEGTQNTKIQNSSILGEANGNGIDLWKSHWNQIENVRMKNVRDGIYLEQSDNNQILRNSIRQSRYGIHLMYSDGTNVSNNISQYNITGAMIMGTKRTTVKGNQFINNRRNVHAQGLLLYDTIETEVMQNQVTNNRVGMYVEKAKDSRIIKNIVTNNFIGVQLKNANENEIAENTFLSNINGSQAAKSTNNVIHRNYWDGALKVDLNHTGISALPYKADSFFLVLTQDIPEYQLFFHSPGLLVLQNLIKIPDESMLIDYKPSMSMQFSKIERGTESQFEAWIISVSMLLMGSILFFLGRKY
ncbi:right handed beta helix region family protein [Bacillus pseudomycoides]|uniref:right-handed parallel beta-helix repeat-containing protein n=1 Tax=Bacillus pseudomycoides TaxID=64104 RepID=UPI0004ED7571|nr:NosD domain-containing protein [Bacillus pseudomycoides]AIK39228.1 right handed beta helix region family protein [Bacillus pseudomycoides]AJI16262.1 right handed beta helix region family protein [Bacillus pseudomycoides]